MKFLHSKWTWAIGIVTSAYVFGSCMAAGPWHGDVPVIVGGLGTMSFATLMISVILFIMHLGGNNDE